jgi:hypothetical protein
MQENASVIRTFIERVTSAYGATAGAEYASVRPLCTGTGG